MPNHAPLFRFLRDCYRDDHRSGALLDVFASRVEARFVSPLSHRVVGFSDSEPTEGFRPFRHHRQKQLAQQAWLGRGEKELLLGSFFVAGRLGTGKGRRICAPLWTWEHARLGEDGVEGGSATVNLPLLRSILEFRHGREPADPRIDEDNLDDELADDDDLAEDGLGADEVEIELDSLLTRIPSVPRKRSDLETATDALREVLAIEAHSGETAKSEALQTLTKTRRGLSCVDCEMLIFRRRSIDSRGVLTELARLADESVLSDCLHRLVYPASSAGPSKTKRRKRRIHAPASLSEPQQAVILNAEDEPLSLVVGPPGTGKSFTIAAAALDLLSRGESVLIVAKTNHAVDVVADKLEAMLGLGEWVVRGGRRKYRSELADRLDRWLEGNFPPFGQDLSEARRLESELKKMEKRIESLERRLEERSRLEVEWGDYVEGASRLDDPGWFESLWGKWRQARRQADLDDSSPYWDLMDEFRVAVERRIELMSELLRHRVVANLRGVLAKDRSTLARLRQSIHASVSRREGFFADLDQRTLLRAAPVWMMRAPDAAQVLPLDHELFDLVIFDEATQCDMASAVPALQRARRCQVVGDPRQLRHLSFLSRQHQQRLARRRGLDAETARRFDYRDLSFLDLVNHTLSAQQQVAFLDEHFRSVPEIIEFSNREFYAGRLRVMQEHPAQRFHRALELRRIEGRRRDAGDNPAEVAAVVDEVEAWVRRQAGEPDEVVHSLGILSPLRAQVEALTSALLDRLSERQLARHDLRVATAYGFQGEERDVMFLSLAVDAESHPSALRYLQRADVFNVAVTRARVRQIVFTSLAADEVPEGLLARYLEHVESGRHRPAASRTEHDDAFLVEVQSRLELDGARVWPEYSVAGLNVDLVVEKNGRCLGIDLVGYPGRFAGSFDLERYRIFNRAGLRLMPLPYSSWLSDAAACARAIEERLASR